MPYKLIQIETQGPIYIAKFNRPPRNLMNAQMVTELSTLLDEVENDDDVRVLILTGGIENWFIQHYDVAELVVLARAAQQDPNVGKGDLHDSHKAFLKIESLSKPVIAAINGQAHGGGFELALACDFRLLAKGFTVGLPEVNVGILPGAGGTQRLPRLIGMARALDLILRGQVVDSERAEVLGMITRAVAPDQLMTEALALANQLAALSPAALASIKRIIRQGIEVPLHPALRIEQEAFWELMRTDLALQRMEAYATAGQPAS